MDRTGDDLHRAHVFLETVRDAGIKAALRRALEPHERAAYAGQLLRSGMTVPDVRARLQARYAVSRATAYNDIALAQDQQGVHRD